MHQPFACIVVTYHPDRQALRNLAHLAAWCDLLVVVDNTPMEARPRFCRWDNSLLILNDQNIGLAAALNQGIRLAGQQGLDNIFLFDQDSRVDRAFFTEMLAFRQRIDRRTDRCALYVPQFFDRNCQSLTRFPQIRKYRFGHHSRPDARGALLGTGIIAITSGSLLPYSRYQEIGPFPEAYFIDFIDNEYCLRMAGKHLQVAVNYNAVLNHAIGHRSQHKWLGLTLKPNNHPPVRRYYIARNGIRTALQHFRPFPAFSALIALRLIHEALTIIIYENRKHKKIRAMLLGVLDGLTGRMGPCTRAAIT
ncbi:glycosyltransferase family 2 protein [Desulfatitalea alkaliphila]|uniref:Glycosyltransferase family 2 protein n=1 Tax=Desulfatitalea alkaliphila TaxID=2929485 RepID=A0AA41R6D4_9BACT|nr:glycosyltransferase family 2 protein [Desulfatitalea alkaliphila]MCJ8502477.1 glycosyltransferase family 2 protein [Desulfatitalea alkaliphila]